MGVNGAVLRAAKGEGSLGISARIQVGLPFQTFGEYDMQDAFIGRTLGADWFLSAVFSLWFSEV